MCALVFPSSNADFFLLLEQAFDGIAVCSPGNPGEIEYANSAFWELMGNVEGDRATEVAGLTNARLVEILQYIGGPDFKQNAYASHIQLRDDLDRLDVRAVRLGNKQDAQIGIIIRKSTVLARTTDESHPRRDPLTGLCDRDFLIRRIAELMQAHDSSRQNFALLFLDLNNFKQINDDHGHLIGDSVLAEAARRIASCVRAGDDVARFGGDEFVAVLHGISEADDIRPIVSRMEAAIAKPIALPAAQVTLTLSAGMVLASAEFGSPEDMLVAADQAMYAAKRTSAGFSHVSSANGLETGRLPE
ncbi:MAG TPA: GGDEF domain-containing protein [Lacipirellulaceae bacterium]|nr:GGDEF domain-containing protein [Lacipirellulaceae bacterium]